MFRGKSSVTIKFLFLLIFCAPQTIFSQGLILEQNPPSIKWLQINSPNFRIIYPEGFGDEAQRTANTLEHLYQPVSFTLQRQPRRIPIILQNQTSISNAFVTIAPRRSEFFTMPPQDYNFLGTNDWIDLLAVHEFRHVVQFDKSITGFNKFIYFLFGADALGAMSFMAVPLWFWEGDAVGIETALTESGRGRIPYFDLVFRTNLLERGPFNYSKQYLRSFKHPVPNHYVTGYFFTTHLRRNYGRFVWSRVTERAFSYSFVPFTFSLALRRETGRGVNRNYWNMIAEVDSLWKKQVEGLELNPLERINKRSNKKNPIYTNYDYPNQLTDGRVLALRAGLGDIQQFVTIDSQGNEQVEFTPGILNDAGMLSVENDRVVWNEFHFDPRWRARNYTVVKSYDLKHKKFTVLTERSRYSAAALSPDGEKLATIEVTENNENYIVVLNAHDGQLIRRLPNPGNFFYSMPRWADDNKSLIVLKHKESGKAVVVFNVEDESETELFERSENIGHPVPFRHYVFFNAPINGIDNIFSYDIDSGEFYQVTTAKFGAYNATISKDGNFIFYNDHQKDGMDVVKIPFDANAWTPLGLAEDRTVAYYQPLVEQEQNPDILDNVPDENYPVRRYRKYSGIINPYSWGAEVSPDDRTLFIGATSQDILSTTAISAGVTLNANERTGHGFAQVSYQGIYPIIDVSGRYGFRSSNIADTDVTWRETGVDAGLRLPLLLTRSKYHESLNLSATTSFVQVADYDATFRLPEQQANGVLHNFRYRVGYSHLLKRSRRDLASRWGQTFFVQYQHTPLGGDYRGALLASEGNMLFPGIGKHHSFQLRVGGQIENAENYVFQSPLFFPRGFAYRPFQYFYNSAIQYRMPLIYPDLPIGPFLYIQRLKANLFYDHGRGFNAHFIEGSPDRRYNSLGIELMADFNVMRFLPLLEMGVRYTYIPETNNYSFQLLIGQFGF